MLLFSQIAPNWRADMESAPTVWKHFVGGGRIELLVV